MDPASIIIGAVLLLGAYSYIQGNELSIPNIKDYDIPPNVKNTWAKLTKEFTIPLWVLIIIGVLMFMFK